MMAAIDSHDVPAGWEIVSLRDLVSRDRRTLNPQDYPREVFEYYSIPAYQDGRRPIAEEGSAIRSLKLVVEPGTVLFGKLNPRVAKVWLVEGNSQRRRVASTEFIPLVPTRRVDEYFLYYLAWSDWVLPKSRELVSGSTPSRQRVDVSAFLELPVPLPPLPEQRAIARVLRTVQRAKEATEQVIAAAWELKKSLMQHLFTYGPVPVTEADRVTMKETEVGPIPEKWKVVDVGELATYINGYAFKSTQWGARGRPIIRIQNLTGTSGDFNYFDGELKERYLVRPGEILVSWSASLGVFKWTGPEAWLNQHIFRVADISDDVDEDFLFYVLLRQIEAIRGRTHGSTMKHVTRSEFLATKAPLPALPAQRDIVEILQAVDRKIAAEEAYRDALAGLFDSLLHDLMTAKLRVRDLIEEVA